ncbi:MAG TPA: HIG1 domain-containing protein [Burkholderiales bacterium]|nr:HIG1 domain-containing protein [Burkholderiales bacterium]
MDSLTVLVLVAALMTLAVLAAGVSSMASDGAVLHRTSGQWMIARVVAQGTALLLIALAQYSS